ncbi:MAG: hypothetical protein R6W69_13810 [Anaerolineales bacterium]
MSENIPVIGWPVLVWLILSQLFYLVLLIPWGLASMMAVMAFDSGVNLYNLSFVVILWSYPIWPILFSILAWIAYTQQNAKMALIWTSVPMVLVVLAVVTFFILVQMGY